MFSSIAALAKRLGRVAPLGKVSGVKAVMVSSWLQGLNRNFEVNLNVKRSCDLTFKYAERLELQPEF